MPKTSRHHALLQGVTCFLFDLDGTLIDSSPCHERAFLKTLESDQPHLAGSFIYEEHKGKSTRETFEALGVNDVSLLKLMTENKQRLYRQMVEDGEVVAFPGAEELLSALRSGGHRLWVVTAASRHSAESALSKLGLISYFEALITGDEASKTKPAPDLYLKCLTDHSIQPRTALALEDALTGIQSAQAAGLNVLAVNNTELSHLPEFVGSLKDLHEAWLRLQHA
ncbi:MAG TPA: HAD family hydrolase [Candidatus Melainabacteria bacterium]|nr:HAD family hydrolase [Candidatus Melainabacteria bacterium]HIN65512.1 HAD family hydrolase [Candidatus Obscuribacterales bacterium]